MNKSALIVAGGKGLRMLSELPKQFMPLVGIPVLMRTITRFYNSLGANASIVVVLPSNQIEFWKELCAENSFIIPHKVAVGGETRFDSVMNGLKSCAKNGIVGIHDGVRPLASQSLILNCFEDAAKHGSSLPVVPVSQSLRKRTDRGSEAVNREGMLTVQTPQCFRIEDIRSAYEAAEGNSFTDDASVFESAGHTVHLSEGEETNLKITTQADLKIAEAILSNSEA